MRAPIISTAGHLLTYAGALLIELGPPGAHLAGLALLTLGLVCLLAATWAPTRRQH